MASVPSGSRPSNSGPTIRPRLSVARRTRGILDARVKKLSANQCAIGRVMGVARCSHECKCHDLGSRLRAELLSLATRPFGQPVPLALQLDSFTFHAAEASQVALFFNTYGKFYHIRKFSIKFPDVDPKAKGGDPNRPENRARIFLSPEKIQPYVIAIKNLPFLEEVSFEGSSLGPWAAYPLAEALRTKTRLRRADFSNCFSQREENETAPALDAIVTALLELPNLESIDLGLNALGPSVEWPILRLVRNAKRLQEIRCNDTGMGPETGIMFAKALVTLAQEKAAVGAPPLRVLLLDSNRFIQDKEVPMYGMPEWAAAFAAHPNLQTLSFESNGVLLGGMAHLIEHGLSHLRALEVLNLYDNCLAEVGSTHRAIANAVGNWPALRELNLSDNLLGSRGAALLIPALAAVQPSKLEVLGLAGNRLNASNVLALSGVFWRLSALRKIDLDRNLFLEKDEGVVSLKRQLQQRGEERGIVTTIGSFDELDSSQGSG